MKKGTSKRRTFGKKSKLLRISAKHQLVFRMILLSKRSVKTWETDLQDFFLTQQFSYVYFQSFIRIINNGGIQYR